MSLVTDKLRRHIEGRKLSLQESIWKCAQDLNSYHRLCGQHHELLSLERELQEIIADLQLAEDTEDE